MESPTPPNESIEAKYAAAKAWILQEKHRDKARGLTVLFSKHPHETGETYLQHLHFTVTMAGRFIFCTVVLIAHGLFPFLFTRTAGKQIEKIYVIMKSRIPKARLDEIDSFNWSI